MSTAKGVYSKNISCESQKQSVYPNVNKETQHNRSDDCNIVIDNNYPKEKVLFKGTKMKLSTFNRTVLGQKSIKQLSDMVDELTNNKRFLSSSDKLTGNRKSLYLHELSKLNSIIELKKNVIDLENIRQKSPKEKLSPLKVSLNNYNYIN